MNNPVVNFFLPNLLDRYIFRQLLDYFLLGVVVFSLVAFFSDALFDFINDIQKYGISFGTLLTIIGLQLPRSVSLVIPASCFLAVLIVYNVLNNNFELISIRMNGISLARLVRPALVIGFLSTVSTYVINDFVVPYCNYQTQQLKKAAIQSGNLPFGRESFMYKAYDKNHMLVQMIYVGNYKDHKLGDSTIIDLSNPRAMQVVQAKAGVYNPEGGWLFENANIYVVSSNANSSSAGHSSTFKVKQLLNRNEEVEDIDEQTENRTDGTLIDSKTQNFWVLWQAIQRREKKAKEVVAEKHDKYLPSRNAYLALWEKITLPLSSVVIILSAVALAINHPRQGGQKGYILALLVLFIYYMLRSVSVAIGRSDAFELGGLLSREMGLILAAWLPIILMSVVGIFLLSRKSKTL